MALKVAFKVVVLFVCLGAGANPLLENENGHRPLAYVKSQQIKESVSYTHLTLPTILRV